MLLAAILPLRLFSLSRFVPAAFSFEMSRLVVAAALAVEEVEVVREEAAVAVGEVAAASER